MQPTAGNWLATELDRIREQHAQKVEAIDERYKARVAVDTARQTYQIGMISIVGAGVLAICGVLATVSIWLAIGGVVVVTVVAMLVFSHLPAINPSWARTVADANRGLELDAENRRYLADIEQCIKDYRRRYLPTPPSGDQLPS